MHSQWYWLCNRDLLIKLFFSCSLCVISVCWTLVNTGIVMSEDLHVLTGCRFCDDLAPYGFLTRDKR